MGSYHSPSIILDGLSVCFDPGNVRSYPGSGTAFLDFAGLGVTGIIANAAFGSTYSGFLRYNGTSTSTSFTIPALTSYTLIQWFNLLSYSGGTERQLLSTPSDAVGFSIVNQKLNIWNGSTNTATTTLTLGTWYMAVATRAGTGTTIYLNAVSDGSFATGANISSGTAAIGYQLTGSTRYIDAFVGPSYYYNRSLTSTEILQNFNALRGRYSI